MTQEPHTVNSLTPNTETEPKNDTPDVESPIYLSLNNLPPLLTIKEAAQILRVSPLTLKRWGKRGKLIPIRINSRGDRRYKREAILWMLGINSPQ